MRVPVAAALAMALTISSALAAGDIAPLAPAKPAGIKQAQIMDTSLWVVLGIGAAVAIVAIAASNGSGSQNYTPPATTA